MSIIAMQELKLNRMYQSEDFQSDDFALNNNNSPLQPHHSESDTINKSQQRPTSLMSKSTLNIDAQTNRDCSKTCDCQFSLEDGSNKNKLKERRSYSNSKLDYHKWQRTLTRRPGYNRIDKWSSYLLSEHELKKFLNKGVSGGGGGSVRNNRSESKEPISEEEEKLKTESINPFMVSSMTYTKASVNNGQIERNKKCKSYSGSLHHHHHNHQRHHHHSNHQLSRKMAKLNQESNSSNLIASYSSSNGGYDGGYDCGGGNGFKRDARASTFKALDDGIGLGGKRNSALVRFGHKLRHHLSSERISRLSGGSRIG
jgi:hypothetical protein